MYEILGVERGADEREIKRAYRSLQKRCHPDIAGPSGHDMAIILNEIYALLSDPLSRSAYDLEQAKAAELKGYTGRPMYSVWLGSETEQRAVFVDEVKCVGCLKCALLADKTFAIESVYGRARVVAQWADPEHKIQESIDACPVNCISIVERSELAALEFLMSKQPRGNVRVGGGNTAGIRVLDVFSEVKVFHKRLQRAMDKKSHQESKCSRLQKEARISAFRAIRSISNWLYWQSPASETSSNLTSSGAKRSPHLSINKLKEAAARGHNILKTRSSPGLLPQTAMKDEYWVPLTSAHPLESKDLSDAHPIIKIQTSAESSKGISDISRVMREHYERSPLISSVPMGLAVVAVGFRLHGAGEVGVRLEEHIGGSVALEVVNSPWLQVLLAGATWYIVGVIFIQMVESVASKSKMK